MTPDLTTAFAAFPAISQAHAWAMRSLILHTTADMPELGGLNECLKWGQPAYLARKPRIGTTLRIGAHATALALYLPCTTSLVAHWRETFPDQRFSKNRAALFAFEKPLPADVIGLMVRAALRYHLAQRS